MVFRLIFALLFFANFIWQFSNIIISQTTGSLSMLEIVLGALNMVFCLMFAMVAILYALQDQKTIVQIKKRGKAVKNITLFSAKKKDSFIRMYSFIMRVVAVVMLLVLASGVTYAILELIHYSTISFYLPLLITFALSGFNSVLHMNYEVNLMQNVQEYHSIY